jgi:hypothetical protein
VEDARAGQFQRQSKTLSIISIELVQLSLRMHYQVTAKATMLGLRQTFVGFFNNAVVFRTYFQDITLIRH